MYVCIDPARAACVNPPAFPLQMAVFDCVRARTRRKIHEITSPKPSYLPLCSSAAVSIPRCYNVDEAPCSRWDQVHRGRGSKTPPRAVLASQAQYRARVGMDESMTWGPWGGWLLAPPSGSSTTTLARSRGWAASCEPTTRGRIRIRWG